MNKKSDKKPIRKRVNSPFAVNLESVMNSRGLSFRAVAEICGVNPAVVHAWVNGAQPQNLQSILNFCVATSIDFQWLLTGVEKEKFAKPSMEDFFSIQLDPILTGMFQVEVKRLIPKPVDQSDYASD